MFGLIVALLVILGFNVIYLCYQTFEGDHPHMQRPGSNALAMLGEGAVFAVLLYALFHWI